MKLIPAMDLIDNQVVRLEQGDYNRVTVYSDDILKTATSFKQAGMQRLHLVDLTGAKQGQPAHAHLIEKIKKETGMNVEYGGGIRKKEHVDALVPAGFKAGKDFVMIGSLPFKDPGEFSKIKEVYRDGIILTVDVWGEDIRISGWQESTHINIFDFIEEQLAGGLNYFLVTQIKKDGMMTGPDFELYQALIERFDGLRLIASGGVSSIEDLNHLKQLKGLDGAIIGRAFYSGAITLEQLAAF